MIEESNGKKTGYGLVFFTDEESAQRARNEKNKQSLGKRYIDILEVTEADIYA